MNKAYIKPKITSVEMSPDQALLQACAVGGLYLWTMGGSNTHCNSRVPMGIGPACNLTPKGGAGGGTSMSYTLPGNQAETSFPS